MNALREGGQPDATLFQDLRRIVEETNPSGSSGETHFSRTLEMIQDNRVQMVQQYQFFINADNSFDDGRRSAEDSYRAEVDEAQAFARQCYDRACTNEAFAERYAGMTVELGKRAIQECESKDHQLYESREVGRRYEHLASYWELNAQGTYREAMDFVGKHKVKFLETENSMQTLKSEVEIARESMRRDESLVAELAKIREKIPSAERRFAEMQKALDSERKDREKSDSSRIAVVERLRSELSLSEGRVSTDNPLLEAKLMETEQSIDNLTKSLQRQMSRCDELTSELKTAKKEKAISEGHAGECERRYLHCRSELEEGGCKPAPTPFIELVEDDEVLNLRREVLQQRVDMDRIQTYINQWNYDWTIEPEGTVAYASGSFGGSRPANAESEHKEIDRPQIEINAGEAPAENTNVRIATTLTEPAKAGDTILQVVSSKGMKIGQTIRIGTVVFEEAKITAFGSIHLDRALAQPHAIGERITIVDANTWIPNLRLDQGDDSDDDTVQTATGDSSDSSGRGGKVLSKNIKIPNLPKRKHEVRTFHMNLVDEVLKVSCRNDNKEQDFLDAVIDWSKNTLDIVVDHVPRRMVYLDRALKPQLIQACKSDHRLSEEIERKRLQLNDVRKYFCARRILLMIYSNLTSDTNMLEICTIRDLSELDYFQFGDKLASKFWHEFTMISNRMTTPLSEEHKRDILFGQLRKSEGFKYRLLQYKDEKEERKTFDTLADSFQRFITDMREEERLETELGERRKKDNKQQKHLNPFTGNGKDGKGKGQGEWTCTICDVIVYANKDQCFKCGAQRPKGGGKGKPSGKGKDAAKGGKGGKGGKDDSKRPRGPLTQAERAARPCAYFQTDLNGGRTCNPKNGKPCGFGHWKVSKAEYDAMFKPWENGWNSARQSVADGNAGRSPVGSPRDALKAGNPSAKSKASKPFAAAANMKLFCSKYMECPGRAESDGGTGTCTKVHSSKAEAARIIAADKERMKKEKKAEP